MLMLSDLEKQELHDYYFLMNYLVDYADDLEDFEQTRMKYLLEEDDYDLASDEDLAREFGRALETFRLLYCKRATKEELFRVAKYIDIVMECTRHLKLNYVQAFRDLKIREIKEKYGLYHKR